MGPDQGGPDDRNGAGETGGTDGSGAGDEAAQAPGGGRIRRQEPGSTVPRPPTVGEARARDKARKDRAEQERLAAEAEAKAEERRRKRKKGLIGGVAVVGVVGLVALGYTALSSDEVQATCIDPNTEVEVDESYCTTGTPGTGGMAGMFIFAGSPYRYYYGGSAGGVGTKVTGGTVVTPKGTTITTKSGTTIQRGGFGSKSTGSGGS
ncbi:hypothetical protein C8K38_11338 [Rhodococcus sp. OK611]|nr:hypothetical protein C8K38_11338 [Rhodococcus sp. OK611]SNX92203.1 hypothetical protein SAMN05447004_11338 [Rhodococcus sp. OK270]